MKKQSGFTLIELLLVLAIIGIISAIAIPALLSQRSRARDKAAISNMTGRIGDLIGQYDKNKEAGMASTAMSAALQTYLNNTAGADKNPWDPATAAFDNATAVANSTTGSTAALMATDVSGAATVLGQPVFKIFYPTATQPGFIGGAVLVQNTQTSGTKKVIKVSSIE
jgi:prepilin-type N-terminal cleavage/methylation domain-containing protein